MRDLILYAEQPKNLVVGPCTHNISKFDSRFYLPTEYAKKYNNCVFCAIQAWGYMTHSEIAKCLGTTRINVCLIEKKAIQKIRKTLGYSSLCRIVDECPIEIYGIVDSIQKRVILEITKLMVRDIGNITKPIVLKFSSNQIVMNNVVGIALYENKNNNYHKITFNTPEIGSVKEFIETLLHEISHAAQIESGKPLSDKISEAISKQFSRSYREKYQRIMKNICEYGMIGSKNDD